MQRVAAGDSLAFAMLYQKTSAKLLGILLRIVRERSRAEDILQDVYIKVWEQAASYKSERGSPMAWLIIMARSRALDDLRRYKKFVSADTLPEFENSPADLAHPLDEREQQENTSLLLRCLDGLEQMKKEMVLLAYQGGLSREELAARFKTPVATVKTWLRRSLDSLRVCMNTHV